jgi:acetyl esterase/lipase
MRRAIALSLLALLAGASGARVGAGRADAVPGPSCGPGHARKAVLVIHGGGFKHGSTGDTKRVCDLLGAHGFYVENLRYPLDDLRGAEHAAEDAAHELREDHAWVFAYGESAGGTLAALLAARREVSAAYAWAPVSDLTSWAAEAAPGFVRWTGFPDARRATLEELSPITWASPASAPLQVDHGRADAHVPPLQSERLQAKWGAGMTLRLVGGGHVSTSPGYRAAPRAALAYFTSG